MQYSVWFDWARLVPNWHNCQLWHYQDADLVTAISVRRGQSNGIWRLPTSYFSWTNKDNAVVVCSCLGGSIIILSVGYNLLICKSESIIVLSDLASCSNPPNMTAHWSLAASVDRWMDENGKRWKLKSMLWKTNTLLVLNRHFKIFFNQYLTFSAICMYAGLQYAEVMDSSEL